MTLELSMSKSTRIKQQLLTKNQNNYDYQERSKNNQKHPQPTTFG